jgi:hypothetical protein
MLPQPRIGDDSDQQTDISALVGRQAQIGNVAKTNFGREGLSLRLRAYDG